MQSNIRPGNAAVHVAASSRSSGGAALRLWLLRATDALTFARRPAPAPASCLPSGEEDRFTGCMCTSKFTHGFVISQQVINATMYIWMSHIPTPTVSPLPLSTLAMAPTNGIGVVAMARECFPGKSLRGQAAFYRGRRGTAAPLCNPSALKHVSELRPDIPRVRCLVSRGDASRAAHGSRADAPPRRREGFIGWRRR